MASDTRIEPPMAERLIEAGHRVSVYNRTKAKIAQWRTDHADVVDAPADVARSTNSRPSCRACRRGTGEVNSDV
ncbi:NAD binding domain of 6-phosphogluconate dehydrogenase [Mycobacteroides abscessus subsp. bolletii]|uniref:NAD(P)-binding domain-containing protein n=1 Tax=Mycobacteroides abscessus TaxID=36809 RepID=UPI0009A5B770|nr:NAD(P)-binding domain-containing protein [Mycobacteroides abscessus]SKG68369.1 NAD binding domain of 6-phosphogluconate dehydrogenase [Mycobacteroides abscessus subsp. bolletii]SKH13136.1 NAD binding domain of 6-phosphogluconate dehydrogenase [Mycobacteroides abscessus subsp. bolletii]